MVKENIEHINHALVAKAHTPMYLMHKYWARKPHNVVAEYIKHYSKEGDIVLDPFSGSGVTAIEAIKAGRKAVAIDLDPIATFIARMTAMPIDLEKVEEAFKEIEANVKDRINELYETKCEKCGKKIAAEALIWKDNIPQEVRYSCDCQKNKREGLWKDIDKKDIQKTKKIEKTEIPYWYPTNELIWNTRINVHKGACVCDLFTRRNLFALSMLYNEIEKIKDQKIKDLMKFVFSSALPQASKMVFVIRKRGRETGEIKETKEVGSWATRGYWIPKEYFEINAWNCFEERFRKIERGKKESNEKIKNYKEAKNFSEINDDSNVFIKTYSVIELDEIIKPNSVDYVFTDPPYGDSVPYLELDYMWNSWLKHEVNFDDEIIISDSPARKDKNFDLYHKMLKAAFRQVYLALKHGKYLTVTFHSTDIKIWNSIIRAVVLNGFNLEKIIYQPPARASAKGLLAPYGSAVGDYYIRFKKPETEKIKTEKQMDMQSYEREVVMSARGIIINRGEPTIYQHILNGIMVDLNGGRNAPIGARNIEEVLEDQVGKEFELIPVKDNKGKVVGKKWWIKGMDLSAQNFTEPALSDRIERVILHLLNKRIKVSFDDVLQAIFMQFPNALTPDTQSIKEVLEEYARKTDGKWMLKAGFTEQEMISEHSKMIYFLANLGKKAGFEVWIGSQEQGRSYNKKPLSELSDPYVTFRNILSSERAKQIDVIWHDTGRIKYAFEVETTTGITDAIIRGSNLRPSVEGMDLYIKKFIVIQERRSKLLQRKLNEPLIKDSLKRDKWNFIFYKDLEESFKKNKSKESIDAKYIEKITKIPKLNNQKQANLLEY